MAKSLVRAGHDVVLFDGELRFIIGYCMTVLLLPCFLQVYYNLLHIALISHVFQIRLALQQQ